MMKKDTVIIDYAYPCMMAEKALKDLHDAVLDRNLNVAIEHAMETIVQARLVLNALKHMKDKENESVQ
jgi:hypothetical protein